MQNMENEPKSSESAAIEPPPPSQDKPLDSSQGYVIHLGVFPEGFTVSGPFPPESHPDTPLIPTIRDAFRELLSIHKDNPMSHDAQEQFDAGYGE